ncbi:MAG: excinuclease ABC subunit UvrB [Thermoplasmatota archaeon]
MADGFRLVSPFSPTGDQPAAIDALTKGLEGGMDQQTLLGVTGSGKTFTVANVIAKINRPTLVISHNKTLAAQLYEEFKEFFPDNAVHYFVSYYDYYMPEAYVPQSDLYIAKEADINEEIDKMRHAATAALAMGRRDVLIVASVSCIYGIGSPQEYKDAIVGVRKGETRDRNELLADLVGIYYKRNDASPEKGTFGARGDLVEVRSPDGAHVHRLEFFGDEIESIALLDPVTKRVLDRPAEVVFFPAKHFVTPEDEMKRILGGIEQELSGRLSDLRRRGKLVEAQRLESRVRYDLEMLREVGYVSGVENYSRHFSGRKPGEAPYTLLDYFPTDFVTIIDESHVTIPQIRGMYAGDRSRKEILVEHGFRLPSALDNRPLKFEEWTKRMGPIVYVSATPGPYELGLSKQVVEQVVRPTGLLDPKVEVRASTGQVDDLLGEIRKRAAAGERVLVTTLTKQMAEDLTNYYASCGVRVRYLHSDVATLDRVDVLEDLRTGTFDVLVGINLLREGLDLPEVSLVAVFDADKEGFLRAETSLIQTMGRAARNVNGTVILYADSVTPSMERAMRETERRRLKQQAYNDAHGITPTTIRKSLRRMREREAAAEPLPAESELTPERIELLATEMEAKMRTAAKRLDFETAALYRDRLRELRKVAEST